MVKKFSKQARITTSGVNKTTPGMERKPIAERIPVDIYGRTYVDPKKADLTDIEKAYDKAKSEAEALSNEVTEKISKKKKEDEDKRIDALATEKAKTLNPDSSG